MNKFSKQLEFAKIMLREGIPIFTKVLPRNPKLLLETSKNVIDNVISEGVKKALSLDINRSIGNVSNLYCRLTSTDGGEKEYEYLRPTFCCESNDAKIIALANSLGAYDKDEITYANACFEWVKRNIKFRTTTLIRGAKSALDTGEGMCSDKQGLFIALCWVGGIPARYEYYPLGFKEETHMAWIESGGGVLEKSYEILQHFMGHTCAEVYINPDPDLNPNPNSKKRWIVADPTFPPKYEVGLGIPISCLGEDISAWSYRAGDIIRFAEIPMGLYLMLKFFDMATPDILDRINRQIAKDEKKGEKILGRIGEKEYNKKIRIKYEYLDPKIEV